MRQTSYSPPVRGGRADPAMLRVSHADRDAVVDRLKTAFSEGRLDKDEFDGRLGSALTARTRADLDRLLRDVSVPRPVPHRFRPARVVRPTPEERAWAMLAHWLGLVTWVIGPGVIAATKGRRSAFVRAQAIEAMNFQITWALVLLAMPILALVSMGIAFMLVFIMPLVMIIGGFIALGGSPMRYPLCLRLIKR